MKGQYHLIRRFKILKAFRVSLLADKTTLREHIDYGAYWYDYLVNDRTKKLTRIGQHLHWLVDNAEQIYLEREIENKRYEKSCLTRLAELKNNAIPVIDPKRLQQILARRERKKKCRKTSL